MEFRVLVTAKSSLVIYAKNREELNRILDEMTEGQLMEGYWIDNIKVNEEED